MISVNITKELFGADGLFKLNFTTEIHKGEFVTISGPTGAGKSSVLRMIAGLLKPKNGTIIVDGQPWFDDQLGINLPPQKRNIGMVFQDYSLFPNLSVRGNLTYALAHGQDTKVVDHLLEVSGLSNLQNKKPLMLSGGQKQRVAVTRALINKPKLLLLDEPLSALDSMMRKTLQNYISEFHNEFNLTTILVSHDHAEVKKMSERVLVLENGKICQDGNPNFLL